MKKKNAIIFLVANTIYLALVFYVKGTLYPVDEGFRFLVALLFCVINGFIVMGISVWAFDD